MRDYFEELEIQTLSPLALKSRFSKGRRFEEPHSGNRTCFQRDRDRIIHSKAFRRLKHKTQVFVASESDHYRSRLTHSLEVAQISRHMGRLLKLNEDVCEAIALAHDLGHTPFGHAGEKTLSELMRDFGGFEHNLQSLRIVDDLETKYPQFPGLNLSFEIREGLHKHSSPWDHPEGADHFVSLEAQVCNLGDEISYNNHDLDDGLRSGILDLELLVADVTLWREAKALVQAQYSNLSDGDLKYLINSYLISSQIEDVVRTTEAEVSRSGIDTMDDLQQATTHLVRFSPEMRDKATELREYLFDQFYTHPHVYRMNQKGQHMIRCLFGAFSEDMKLLPTRYQDMIGGERSTERVIADYIAGMTDTFAEKEYSQIFV